MSRLTALLVVPLLAFAHPAVAGYTPIDHGDAGRKVAHAQVDEHDAHAAHAAHPAAAADIAADHQRWEPDAPLREGMRRMRTAVDALSHGEHGHLDPAQVQRLAKNVEDAAGYMFQNCTLAPEPDAALHGVLARLLGGARALAADPADTGPVTGMREALADYPRLFDDPEFAEPALDAGG